MLSRLTFIGNTRGFRAEMEFVDLKLFALCDSHSSKRPGVAHVRAEVRTCARDGVLAHV